MGDELVQFNGGRQMKVRGVVKGKTIVLAENLDFEDGETVEVEIRAIEKSRLEK